jgi:predicted RNA-binding protein with TRAM domain
MHHDTIPRTINVGQAAIVGGFRVLVLGVKGQRVTLGFQLVDGEEAGDVIEISVDATRRDLTFRRISA